MFRSVQSLSNIQEVRCCALVSRLGTTIQSGGGDV